MPPVPPIANDAPKLLFAFCADALASPAPPVPPPPPTLCANTPKASWPRVATSPSLVMVTRATRAAGPAGAADRHCERYGDAVLRTGRIRRRRAVTTAAAATTDRLRHDPDRAIAGCGDQPRIAEPDGAGGVAGAALATDRGREGDGRDLRVARNVDRTRRRDSAIAAATADAVNIDAVGVRPIGRDLPLVDDGNIASRATARRLGRRPRPTRSE